MQWIAERWQKEVSKRKTQEFVQSELSRISESKQTKIVRNPKELKMFKKSISMLVMALFAFSFIAVPAVFADEMQKITGTVDYFNPATGELTIKDDTGDAKKLKAGPEVDMESLKNLKQGDSINVECDSKGVITSLTSK